MKIKRRKGYRKTIHAYSKYFGLNIDPLEIFMDSTFVQQAINNKLQIEEQLKCTINCPFSLVTSACIIRECESLGTLFHGTLQVLKSIKILKCRHPIAKNDPGVSCILRRIKSAKKSIKYSKNLLFGVASNDDTIREQCEHITGMPVFYIAHKRINLEPVPSQTEELIQAAALKLVSVTSSQDENIRFIEGKFGLSKVVPIKRTKRAKGPNPLSCKRKILHSTDLPKKTKKRRKRNRIKITWAMKQAIEALK